MNEIDFYIECKRNRLTIIVIINKSLLRITDVNNREYIIVVKIINVVDTIILSFLYLRSVLLYIF